MPEKKHKPEEILAKLRQVVSATVWPYAARLDG